MANEKSTLDDRALEKLSLEARTVAEEWRHIFVEATQHAATGTVLPGSHVAMAVSDRTGEPLRGYWQNEHALGEAPPDLGNVAITSCFGEEQANQQSYAA